MCAHLGDLQTFNYFVILWIWGRETLFYTARKAKILICFHRLIMFGLFLSSQIRIKRKLWNISFWSSKCVRLTKYAALYSYRVTQSTDLTKYFSMLKTPMKAAYPMHHFYFLSSCINLSTGNCSPPQFAGSSCWGIHLDTFSKSSLVALRCVWLLDGQTGKVL